MTNERENRFYHYAARYLREEFPRETADFDDESLKKRLDRGLSAAQAHGFSTEAAAMAFVDADIRLDGVLSAGEPPQWAREILDNPGLSATEKIFWLRDACGMAEWMRRI
jgi:hypothetical protein